MSDAAACMPGYPACGKKTTQFVLKQLIIALLKRFSRGTIPSRPFPMVILFSPPLSHFMKTLNMGKKMHL
jgi:hypothetical protein